MMQHPPSIVEPRSVRSALTLPHERRGRLLDVSRRTVERMEESGRQPRSASVAQRLGELAHIVELGQPVSTPEGWRKFLSLPQPRFGGRTALQLLERGEAQTVIGALATDYERASP